MIFGRYLKKFHFVSQWEIQDVPLQDELNIGPYGKIIENYSCLKPLWNVPCMVLYQVSFFYVDQQSELSDRTVCENELI